MGRSPYAAMLDLDLVGAGPLHARLPRAGRVAIRDGRLPVGSAVPPSRALAEELGCSRWVVTEAYGQLVAEGYLVATVGAATRVAWTPSPSSLRRRAVSRGAAAATRYDLSPGLPDLRGFPRRRWAEAVRTVAGDAAYYELGVPDPDGHPDLRSTMADYLARARGADVRDAVVTVTAGVTDGLVRACRARSDPRRGRADADLASQPRPPRRLGRRTGVLRRSIDDNLRRLGVDHVDLYYVHVDDRSTPLEETLSTLASFVSSGKARYIDYSNVRTWRFERIRQLCASSGWPEPVALQQQHSYLRRRAGLSHASIVDDEQMDYLRANREVSLVAYSPVLKGAFDDPRKDGAMWTYVGPDTDARLDVLGKEAASLGVTPGQLVLAWLLHQTDPAMIPLIGPRTFAQYEAAMAALDIMLDADTLRRLDEAGA